MSSIFEKIQEKVPANVQVILLGEHGSTAHGVALDSTDHDFMGIAIEPKDSILGLESYEHTILKSGGSGEATEAGDSEGTIYGLKKFTRLAESGNTSIMSLLYLPNYAIMTPAGELLHSKRELFRTTNVLSRFAGHLTRERRRMDGELAEKVLRPELISLYGYDTKAAYRALKLAFHGRRFAREGRLVIPFPLEERKYILSVRRGEVPKEEIKGILTETVEFLEREAEHSSLLPFNSNRAAINELLEEIYSREFFPRP